MNTTILQAYTVEPFNVSANPTISTKANTGADEDDVCTNPTSNFVFGREVIRPSRPTILLLQFSRIWPILVENLYTYLVIL